MTPSKQKDPMVWMDLEMTGLDPENERIIEIATLITDGNLNVLEQGPNLVIHQPLRVLKKMDEWNQKHHKKSGLYDAVIASKITLKKAEKQTLDFIKKHCAPQKSPLCGNSVHHDRRFLVRYMPKISGYLHYRIVDVSSIRGVVDRWYPKSKEAPKKNDKHRALDDILESIEELRFFRKKYFR